MSDEITQYVCSRCKKPLEGDPWQYIIDAKPVDRPCFDAFAGEANAGPAGAIVPQPQLRFLDPVIKCSAGHPADETCKLCTFAL